MGKIEKNEEREDRIVMEIIVDAYDAEEQAMGWYYYLEDKITFPFEACVMQESGAFPLRKDEVVTVIGMANESECLHRMVVKIKWQNREFGVPLEQLYPVHMTGEFNEDTVQAIEDWHYWANMGYRL